MKPKQRRNGLYSSPVECLRALCIQMEERKRSIRFEYKKYIGSPKSFSADEGKYGYRAHSLYEVRSNSYCPPSISQTTRPRDAQSSNDLILKRSSHMICTALMTLRTSNKQGIHYLNPFEISSQRFNSTHSRGAHERVIEPKFPLS
ncbi:hypothetical protein BX666DRAFT_894044 [Dichotomocladium elegans]|nr:hypothetical protein BX666DRAFT_894044 [Dichotomocladium elegans]